MAGEKIHALLEQVEFERMRRQDGPDLSAAVQAVKRYQHDRLQSTYADLLSDPPHVPAARFFLDELYGPQDFAARDAQFARIVPSLRRLFSDELVQTVEDLAELHAQSERLDSLMGEALLGAPGLPVDAERYGTAWRATGERGLRDRQIELLGRIGRSLTKLTRRPMLRQSLRLMRAPARAAGFEELQRFLESGFDTFKTLQDPDAFLRIIESRETALAASLFDARPPHSSSTGE